MGIATTTTSTAFQWRCSDWQQRQNGRRGSHQCRANALFARFYGCGANVCDTLRVIAPGKFVDTWRS
ncbi:MAG: hypothetical protein R3C26_11720 [Calditrichia bacterium]